MFTGIVRELGKVDGLKKERGICRISVKSKDIYKEARIGDSISVNGVCLTVTGKIADILSFDVMEETSRRSTLLELGKEDIVNLEGALRAGDVLGGHFVTGHIDCTGKIASMESRGESVILNIIIPREFEQLVVGKGSIALDGVSLTVGKIEGNILSVHIIPHTLKVTTLGFKEKGDKVNVEFDILGKYVIKAREKMPGSRVTEGFLKEHGF